MGENARHFDRRKEGVSGETLCFWIGLTILKYLRLAYLNAI